MKVLAIAFVYNEIELIGKSVQYYHNNGCDVYVIDNMSNDGTWEWLQANNIPSSRCDTGGAFQLEWLQTELLRILHILKPDWFLWFAPDLFHVFDSPIKETIQNAEYKNYNQISSPCYCFKNTGEERNGNPWETYFYASKNNRVVLISKYFEEIGIMGDAIHVPFPKVFKIGIILEYGGTKPVHIQDEKLARRKRAWELGTPKNHGTHYLQGKENNWIYQKEDCLDLRHCPEVLQAVSTIKHYTK